jgi:hypothetical protein
MNRFILTSLLAFLAGGYCVAQDYSICSQVIGSAGRTVTLQNQRWSYTIGETAIETIVDPMLQITVTQGFHQPELCSVVSTDAADLDAWNIRIYPNPTVDQWLVEFDLAGLAGLQYSISNTLGQIMIAQEQVDDAPLRIDCTGWQPGIYFLQMNDPVTKARGTLRLLKL